MEELLIFLIIEFVCGGMDGLKIFYLGILILNIFVGGENMYGCFEFVLL